METPVPDLPVVGTAGHTLGSLVINASKEIENLKRQHVKGCPVNRRIITRITRRSFRRMCLKFQKRAGIFEENQVTGSSSTKYGWVTNNISICSECKIGINVRAGKRYSTPYNILFVTKGELHGCVAKKDRG